MHARAQHALTTRSHAGRAQAGPHPALRVLGGCWVHWAQSLLRFAACCGAEGELRRRGGQAGHAHRTAYRRCIAAPGAGAVPAVPVHARSGTIGRSAAAQQRGMHVLSSGAVAGGGTGWPVARRVSNVVVRQPQGTAARAARRPAGARNGQRKVDNHTSVAGQQQRESARLE